MPFLEIVTDMVICLDSLFSRRYQSGVLETTSPEILRVCLVGLVRIMAFGTP